MVAAAATADPTPLPPAAGLLAILTGDVAFDFDSPRIRPVFFPEFDRIAAALWGNPAERLALVGHTDAIGGGPTTGACRSGVPGRPPHTTSG